MAEFALVSVLMVALLAGTLELGRAWSAAEVLTAAVRDGARVAAVTDEASRVAAAEERVDATAGTYFTPADVSVVVSNDTTAGGQAIVTVTATGSLELLFGGLLPIGQDVGGRQILVVRRSATFVDETGP
jgi:Flp pilus assembly protein TadG